MVINVQQCSLLHGVLYLHNGVFVTDIRVKIKIVKIYLNLCTQNEILGTPLQWTHTCHYILPIAAFLWLKVQQNGFRATWRFAVDSTHRDYDTPRAPWSVSRGLVSWIERRKEGNGWELMPWNLHRLTVPVTWFASPSQRLTKTDS